MSVAVLITAENQIDEMVGWGQLLAESESAELIVLVLQKSSASKQWVEVDQESERSFDALPAIVPRIADSLFEPPLSSFLPDSNPEHADNQQDTEPRTTSSIRILRDRQPEWALVDEIHSLNITLLALPEFSLARSTAESESWPKSLYRQAPCETIQLDTQTMDLHGQLEVLVVATGGADDFTAVKRGLKIAEQSGGNLTAAYFQPDIDPVAVDVGKKILRNIVNNAVGQKSSGVTRQVVLANNIQQGLGYFDLSKFSLVICGTRNIKESNRFLSIPSLEKKELRIGKATVRKPIPLTNRFVNRIQTALEGFIPQLKRDQRIELVNRIQSSSKWDFDFGILISLSTLIAALGLIRNNASVVIGAMLVAPLMTPIVGTGLGLAQSNVRLVRNSLRTVMRGFATAFIIGMVIGILTWPDVTPEMSSRGSPSFLDLVVALVSGIAAAYALGRPNLLSALPGVAIAAALVPPLATSGMALSVGAFHLSYGSLLLFCTNIVAIILGTTITFWTVGVRQVGKEGQVERWPLYLFLFIVLLSVGLTIMMSYNAAAEFIPPSE